LFLSDLNIKPEEEGQKSVEIALGVKSTGRKEEKPKSLYQGLQVTSIPSLV